MHHGSATCGVRGREVKRHPSSRKVQSSNPWSDPQLRDCLMARTF